jgi:hypothetical protein
VPYKFFALTEQAADFNGVGDAPLAELANRVGMPFHH